ncbi:MAG: DUF2357 domain-containing protein [Desulfobacterales bacterium]|nr:DUF2357 domain-containing protein [Desulfobacterales bacterium]MDD4072316.1 DUF2357 domain-containing protein [Desulfobacterales bacterium]MDD4393679.1 DUF2357 domain-containing protein [Desulfobacterales bacterium]
MMPAPIAVSFHHWPWSVDVEEESVPATSAEVVLPFRGSPVLSVMPGTQVVLAARYEKFVSLGPVSSNGIAVYEAPHGIISQTGRGRGDVMVTSGRKRWELSIEALGAKRRTLEDGKTESPLARMVLGWSQFYDDLLDEKVNGQSRTGIIPWSIVLKFLKEQRNELQQPRLSLIVRIAEELQTSLSRTVSGMRRILLRERNMQRIDRIGEADVQCLQWYVRQSGANMAEKGGRRQELLAVVRRESFDVLENRVLKDFMHRCNVESLRYISSEVDINSEFVKSKRAQDVRRFRKICLDGFNHPDFKGVLRAGVGVRPNYVLQNDLRYRKVWAWYCRLLRREEEEDRFWDWQARTWADIVRLLVNLAIVYIESEEPPNNGICIRKVLRSSLHVTREQMLGSRTCGGSEPGPFVIDRIVNGKARPVAILEVVHPDEAHEHILSQNLGRTGGHLYLVIRPLGEFSSKSNVLIVWAVNSAGADLEIPWEDISRSATSALGFHRNILAGWRIPNLPMLQGLVVTSSIEAEGADLVRESSDSPVLVLPADPRQWYGVMESIACHLYDRFDRLV